MVLNLLFWEKILLYLISFPFISKLLRFVYSWPLTTLFIPFYIKIFSCNQREMLKPWWSYPSLRSFFSREINLSERFWDKRKESFICPVDGKIASSGQIKKGRLMQVKGQEYSLEEFLDDSEKAERYEGGSYLSIYMSPGDYHRIHAPIDAKVISVKTLRGRRYPVNHYSRLRIPAIYQKNARTIVTMSQGNHEFTLVFVGSCQVGSIKTLFNPAELKGQSQINKGQQIGYFDFGSTVILLWPPGGFQFENKFEANNKLKMGQILGSLDP
jgi:phosphatidylserine decarboxylase